MRVQVNENAYDTWLDPYIGWEFTFIQKTKTHVYFLIDIGFGKMRKERELKEYFDRVL